MSRRALIQRWASYLDALSSYLLSTQLPNVKNFNLEAKEKVRKKGVKVSDGQGTSTQVEPMFR